MPEYGLFRASRFRVNHVRINHAGAAYGLHRFLTCAPAVQNAGGSAPSILAAGRIHDRIGDILGLRRREVEALRRAHTDDAARPAQPRRTSTSMAPVRSTSMSRLFSSIATRMSPGMLRTTLTQLGSMCSKRRSSPRGAAALACAVRSVRLPAAILTNLLGCARNKLAGLQAGIRGLAREWTVRLRRFISSRSRPKADFPPP